ncbi:MAG TPA: hypothetical protein VGF24_04945 [Vicinamibacterales bacterium]
MAKRTLSLIVAAAALALFTPLYITASAAQVNCHVPFSFDVNGTTLPAGDYSIASTGGTLLLRGLRKSAFVMTVLADSRPDQVGRAKTVFLRTGDQYTLIEVWTSDGLGRAIPGTRKHVEERAHAANMPVEQIVIAGM